MKPYYQTDSVIIYHSDCRDILPILPMVDCIVTDPPYESLRRWEGIGTTGRMGLGKKGTTADNPDKLFPTLPNDDLMQIVRQLSTTLRENCHAYIMCDAVTLPHFFNFMRQATPFSNMKPLIWDKMAPGMGYHYRCQHEYVLMFDKGKNRRLNDLGVPDILRYKMVVGKEKQWPTEKPLGLFSLLVKQSSSPGETVIDPFMGCGVAGEAALAQGRKFIGSDVDERACELAAIRLLVLDSRIKAGIAI